MTLTWALVAVAALLLPGRRDTGGSVPTEAPAVTPADPARAARRQRAVAAVAVGAIAVAVLGPVAGLVAAAVGCPATVIVLARVQRRPAAVRPDRSVALVLDLAAAALRAGRPLAEALTAAAPAAGGPVRDDLERVAGLLRLGAEPAQAWSVPARAGPLDAVSATAVRSATSGLRLAAAFERLAAEIRAEAAAYAAARAHRAGVLAMAPLAACFLPSFVCLGVVPVVVGIARNAFGVLP